MNEITAWRWLEANHAQVIFGEFAGVIVTVCGISATGKTLLDAVLACQATLARATLTEGAGGAPGRT